MDYVILAFFCGLSAGAVGKLKGSSFWIWFLAGSVLPLLGTLAAILYRTEHREPRRSCPRCGKVVPLHDQVCTGCGLDLDWPSAAEQGPAPPAPR